MRVVLHNGSGQPASCLQGLLKYAQAVSMTSKAGAFGNEPEIRRYLFAQPVLLDRGEGPAAQGCYPGQRSRIWPANGLNCWEATAHYVGVLDRLAAPVEVHVYDANLAQGRHVFPALRPLGDSGVPEPVILQPPLSGAPAQAVLQLVTRAQLDPRAQGWLVAFEGGRAQAEWYEDALGVAHVAGTAALSIFGLGGLSPVLEGAEREALPDWALLDARNRQQRQQQQQQQQQPRTPESTQLTLPGVDAGMLSPRVSPLVQQTGNPSAASADPGYYLRLHHDLISKTTRV